MAKQKIRECDICGKVFKRHQTMLDHKLDFHSSSPKKMSCPFRDCGYRTNRMGNLNLHLEKIHQLNLYTKKCFSSNCSQKKRREDCLVKHMEKCKHKPFFNTIKCHCGVKVLTEEGLKIHKMIEHPELFNNDKIQKQVFPEGDWRNLLKLNDLIFFSN